MIQSMFVVHGRRLAGLTLAAVCCSVSGCGQFEFGGGSAVVPDVTFLPADLSGDTTGTEPVPGTTDSGDATATAAGPGNFSGRVVLTGTVPVIKPLYVKGADIKNKEVCAFEDVPDERLVLGADNGVANVFVYMRKAPKGMPKMTPPADPLYFDQKFCRFLPHCMIVPVGQTVRVLSDDGIAHNTHTNPKKNQGKSETVPPEDRDGVLQIVYTRAEDPFSVTCDYHSWMKAYHLPLDHPFGAVTDADGNFEIKDIPAGRHEFVVWHEGAAGNYVERKLEVTIVAGETFTKDIVYPSEKLDQALRAN